jgi:hypothetical protein
VFRKLLEQEQTSTDEEGEIHLEKKIPKISEKSKLIQKAPKKE